MTRGTEEKIKNKIKSGRAVLFGTGFAADLFCRVFADDVPGIRCALVSGKPSEESFHGIAVKSLDDFDENGLSGLSVLAAVHESNLREVVRALKGKGAEDIIWVCPAVYEKAFGSPVKRQKLVPAKAFFNAEGADEYWLELRYGAVKDFFEGTDSNSELYKKGMGLYSLPGTVEKRLKEAGKLAASVKKYGLLKDRPILVDEDFRVIDGMHRLACALYSGQREIPCDIIKKTEKTEELLGARVKASERSLIEAGFSGEEISKLKALKAEIREKLFKLPPLISVIIPVYNVEDYIDECMERVTGQTFGDLEIILINDGSEDGSKEKCLEWAKKDKRIRFLDQENRGVAVARNRGIDAARGEYIAFCDPDDLPDTELIASLYDALSESDSDIAECDVIRFNSITGKEGYRPAGGRCGVPYTFEQHMKYAPTACYKLLYRKKLWDENGVRMPDTSFESPAVYALLLALSGHVESVNRGLYRYRVGRKGSLIETGYGFKDGRPNNSPGTDAMRFMVSEFKRLGLYERYKDTVEGAVKYRLGDILATQFHRKSPEDYRETAENFRNCAAELFGSPGPKYMVLGSYILNRMLAYADELQDPYLRFNFSGVVPAVLNGASDAGISLECGNKYRRIMAERDVNGSFLKILREERPEYVFVDLMDECPGLLRYKDTYITLSDAFAGCTVTEGTETMPAAEFIKEKTGSGEAEISEPGSENAEKLWRESFERLCESASECGAKIVAVENYLCEMKGTAGRTEYFEEYEDIRRKNKLLESRYGYIKENHKDITVIPTKDCGLYYADTEYEHGCIPSQPNEAACLKIAALIRGKVFGDKADGFNG